MTGAKAAKDVTFQWLVSNLDPQQGPEKVEEEWRLEISEIKPPQFWTLFKNSRREL